MVRLFRKFFNMMGITINTLGEPQEDDLVSDKKLSLNYSDKELYLKEGSEGNEVKFLQMSIRDKITGKLTEENIFLCRSILNSKVDGINAQQFDFLTSIPTDTRAMKIAKNLFSVKDIEGLKDKIITYTGNSFIDNLPRQRIPAIFTSYILQTAYPTWKAKSTTMRGWMKDILPRNNYTRRITKLDQLQYEKVYVAGWYESGTVGHMFFVDPIATAKAGFNNLHTIEANWFKDGSAQEFAITKAVRKYGSGSKIKIFEITI